MHHPLNHRIFCNEYKDTVGDVNRVVSSWETLLIIPACIDSSIQLSEIWQCCPPHPHQEILIHKPVVTRV